jgi:hypothetical protein
MTCGPPCGGMLGHVDGHEASSLMGQMPRPLRALHGDGWQYNHSDEGSEAAATVVDDDRRGAPGAVRAAVPADVPQRL